MLTGDRGLSHSATVPEGSTVVAGTWWPADYAGEPLVSVEADIAKKLGLKLGDSVTVNILGRNVTARIANLREVKWESLSLNFVLVFSPNTLAGAPHNLLATVTLPKDASLAAEAKFARDLGRAFPATTSVRVKGRDRRVQRYFQSRYGGRTGGRQRDASGGRACACRRLGDGPAPQNQAGRYSQDPRRDAPPNTDGASVGILNSGPVNLADRASDRQPGGLDNRFPVMDFSFSFSGQAAAEAMLLATALVALFGGYGTWRILKAPPVPYLRSE